MIRDLVKAVLLIVVMLVVVHFSNSSSVTRVAHDCIGCGELK